MSHPSISICEWIFGDRDFAVTVDVVRRAGYEAIDIAGEPERSDRAELSDIMGDLKVSGTSAMVRWPTDERDLSHPDRDARRRAVSYFKGCVDLAVDVGAPVVGLLPASVGRVDALTSYAQEWAFAVEGLREVAYYAGEHDVVVAIEPVNRYETFLVNRVEQALALADEAGVSCVGVTADAFHMQLEERDAAAAVALAGDRLMSIQFADSNRLGLGRGHLDLTGVLDAAVGCGFDGSLVMEFTAPGPNPFQAQKDAEAMAALDVYVAESSAWLSSALASRGAVPSGERDAE